MTVKGVGVQWVTDDNSQPGQGATRADAAIVSKSQAIRNAAAELLPVAPTNSAVLLLGEIGVGKEPFGQAIHAELFSRLNEFPITITPLRDRCEEIPHLACTRTDDVARQHGINIESIALESLNDLEQYSWPGNVRELRDLIERAMVVARSPTLAPWHQLAWSVPFSDRTQWYSVHAV